MLKHYRLTAIILSSTILLSGCIGVFLAGAATGGLVVYDRRNLATIAADTRISKRVRETINHDPAFENSHIGVSSFHKMVLLTGQTPLRSLKSRAENIAKNVAEVDSVYNEIAIGGPSQSLSRTSDTWVTTKVKTKLLATGGLKSTDIKVVTENGVVYLMGKIKRSQANLAVDAARRVNGVQKIVKVFRYLPG